MKKLTAILFALTVCMGVFSCSSKKEDSAAPKNITVEKLSGKAYKRIRQELPDELTALYVLDSYDGGENHFILGGSMTVTPVFYTANADFTELQPLEIPDFSTGAAYDVAVTDNGEIIAIVNEVSYGDLPDPNPYAEDYDETLYEENAEYSLVINKFSADGKLISSSEITELYDSAVPENVMISGIFSTDGESCVAIIDDKYCAIGVDGSFKGELKTDSAKKVIEQLGRDSEGNIVCAVNCGDKQIKICRINAETAEIEDSSVTYTFSDGINAPLIPGTGGYTLYIPARNSIYGIKADGSIEAVIDVSSTEINANTMNNIYINADGELYYAETDYSLPEAKLYRYTECDPSELENIPVVTVGTTWDWFDLTNHISAINDSQSDYRVELRNYGEYQTSEAPNGNYDRLAADLISGDAPDIICMDDGGLNDWNLSEKGALCDLYEFMDGDSELSRSSFNANIISLAEEDGHLYSLPNHFWINTAVGKTEFVGDKENWSFYDFLDAWNNRPEGMRITEDDDTKTGVEQAIDTDCFIDLKNGTCSFNSQEYLDILHFREQFPLFSGSGGDLSEEEYMIIWTEKQLSYRNNQAMLYINCIPSFERYFEIKEGYFGGEPITLVGAATNNGTGHSVSFFDEYAISSMSDNKELAWEFLKTFYTDDYYDSFGGCFPMTNSALEKKAKETLEPKEYNYENFTTDYTGYYWYLGEEMVEIGMPAQEDIDFVWDLINGVSRVKKDLPVSIYNIISDERGKFDAGECTAEELADALQNRVSIAAAE